MTTEIICNVTGREVRVAVVENGRVAELHVDRGDDRGVVGNVYMGRVVRVLPGMQAAFVEVGLDRAAFLYVGDIYQDHLHLSVGGDDDDAVVADTAPRSGGRAALPPIQDLLKEGQEIVVQVSKDPIGTKGARLTTHVALPGRYLVYMPTVDHVGISRRIDKERERRRLREFVDQHRPPGGGFIVRTVCEGRTTETLKADMDFLVRTWRRVQEGAKAASGPTLLHSERGLILRTVRDLLAEDVARMVVDDREVYQQVRAFMAELMPELQERVHLYRGAEPVFDVFGVETSIQRSLGRKVWLKSGGYLVIDQTEALMAIDVNSGRFVGTSSLEETTLRINLEAVEEVVEQIRLRNMGGIIIIDFIDMDKETSRQQVSSALEVALRRDRARTNVLGISELGLVEMTRKRVQEGLDRYLYEECPTCRGGGSVKARSTVCFEILRELRREAARQPERRMLLVSCAPSVADQMYNVHVDDLVATEDSLGVTVVIRPLGTAHPEQYTVESE